MRRKRRFPLPLWLLLPAALVAAGAALAAVRMSEHQRDTLLRSEGAALFDGRAALAGRLPSHGDALPALATRCSNCHAGGDAPPAARAQPQTRQPQETAARPDAVSAFGEGDAPTLDRALLLQPRRRRGGPPSSYDRDAFCVLLRRGADPAHVLIGGAMPRYDASDAQCERLWAHVTSR